MSGTHWLPRREIEFAEFCGNVIDALRDTANSAAFGWDTEEAVALAAALHGFVSARGEYLKVPSKENLVRKNAARKTAESALRVFVKFSVRFNKKMRADDKVVFRVFERDEVPTPVTGVFSFPEAGADTSIIRQVTIRYRDSVTKKRGKPHGIHGAEIRWAVLDHTPSSVEEISNSDFNTSGPVTLPLGEADRGKRLYFCLRWETNTNIKGPFGEINCSVIP